MVVAAVVHIVLHNIAIIIIISGAADGIIHKLSLVSLFIRITTNGEIKERRKLITAR